MMDEYDFNGWEYNCTAKIKILMLRSNFNENM